MAHRLDLDRLPAPLEVRTLRGAAFGTAAAGPRRPHRHDYHELIWTSAGTGTQRVDGEPVPVRPGTVTVIGRGQVHVFERGEGITGAVVRFGDEVLDGGTGWLLTARGARTVEVPPSEAERLAAVVGALAAEARRPPDALSAGLQRHLLAVLLGWVERWYEATRTGVRGADDAEVQLHRRFAAVLERDFARHHDAAHYAEALRVPTAALSRTLVQVTGRTTKELVLDRVMLEAARLLRFTGLGVGEVAFRVGFADPLYFSRAFKRHHGEAPQAYRARLAGRA